MVKRIKTLLTSLALSLGLLLPIAAPVAVHAQDLANDVRCGADLTISGETDCNADDAEAGAKVDSILKLAINIFSVVVGFISVIMIIVGGLKYITSGGDSGNITGAKNTILYAIIGLVVVALAQIVVRFVLSRTVGSEA